MHTRPHTELRDVLSIKGVAWGPCLIFGRNLSALFLIGFAAGVPCLNTALELQSFHQLSDLFTVCTVIFLSISLN